MGGGRRAALWWPTARMLHLGRFFALVEDARRCALDDGQIRYVSVGHRKVRRRRLYLPQKKTGVQGRGAGRECVCELSTGALGG